MPIIAVSSEGPSLDDAVDPRFGRAGGFILVQKDGDEEESVTYLDNGEAQMRAQGAGLATCERIASAGVSTVISGYVGPKAFEALTSLGITIIQDMDGMSVREALARYEAGECTVSDAPKKMEQNA